MVKCKHIYLQLFVLLLAFIHLPATAKQTIIDLGTVGETYPVKESDIVIELRDSARRQTSAKEEKPLLERLQTYQPANLHKLPPVESDRTFTVDMSYVLKRDIADANGKIIYPRGFTFNPLNYISFPGPLIVIDGTDEKQIEWFQKSTYSKNHLVKLLLSNGHAFKLAEQLKRPVSYLTDDIVRIVQLTAVPSLVVQRSDYLQIQELLPERRN